MEKIRLGRTGLLRVSPLHCHDFSGIDHFLEVSWDIAKAQAR